MTTQPTTKNSLESRWENLEEATKEKWEEAKGAAREGWNKLERTFDGWFRDEDEYWRENFEKRPYASTTNGYEYYQPAYRFGYVQGTKSLGERWEDAEDSLEDRWERFEDRGELTWQQAKGAVRDAWHRLEERLPGDADNDGR